MEKVLILWKLFSSMRMVVSIFFYVKNPFCGWLNPIILMYRCRWMIVKMFHKILWKTKGQPARSCFQRKFPRIFSESELYLGELGKKNVFQKNKDTKYIHTTSFKKINSIFKIDFSKKILVKLNWVENFLLFKIEPF